jgi:signal transduction histidine kinase
MSSAPSGEIRHRLRFRLAVTFALFGTLVTLLLSIGIFITARHTSDRLMDETLRAELEDYVARRSRNPASLPPATISIRGFVYIPGEEQAEIPRAVLDLPVGKHQLVMDGIPYRISVVDEANDRYVMMFNEIRQRHREEQFFIYLLAGIVIMALVSAGMGWWLAGRVVAPVAELARLISAARPELAATEPAVEFRNDEIGKLASGVFGEYVKRMRAFISREQAFTADVSHELRTPLAIVQGVVELLEEDRRLDEQQRERIDRIRRAVNGMIGITSALLVMAREDDLHTSLDELCDVCEVVRDTVEAHRHLVNAQTTIQLTCHGRPRIAAESTLLKIVVANLIRNAFAHTDSGSVAIVVDDKGVTVTDTGTGIPGEAIGNVFKRHFKGSDSAGAGIGLSLVKRICDRYGWETVIKSAVGHGTTAQLIYAVESTPVTT